MLIFIVVNLESCLLCSTIVGEFVDIMKRCNKSRDYTEIDNAIREKVQPYLYNGGQGKYVPAYEIVHVRQCIKNGLPVTPPTKSSRFSNGGK